MGRDSTSATTAWIEERKKDSSEEVRHTVDGGRFLYILKKVTKRQQLRTSTEENRVHGEKNVTEIWMQASGVRIRGIWKSAFRYC